MIGLKKLASLSHPVRSKTKTNHSSLTNVFPRFVPASLWYYFEFFNGSLHGLPVSFAIDQSDYLGFDFYDTQLKTAV